MILNILFLLVGFAILVYGANLLVDGGAALARRLNISNIVIGLTVVAFGTSAPELVVNLVSSAGGNTALALGNVLGSNIFNILGILGITAMIYPLAVKRATTWIEIPLAVLAAALVLLFVNSDSEKIITRAEGVTLLFFFLIFMIYTFVLSKKEETNDDIQIKNYTLGKSILFIILGLAGLVGGGRLLVTGAVNLAEAMGISERIIALTIVSIGTSLPELATSVVAARKKNADIAIGNVVGSNLFNTFLVLGASATLTPIPVSSDSLTDLIVNLAVSLLLFVFIFTGKGRKINRWEGIVFIAIYLAYLTVLLLSNIK